MKYVMVLFRLNCSRDIQNKPSKWIINSSSTSLLQAVRNELAFETSKLIRKIILFLCQWRTLSIKFLTTFVYLFLIVTSVIVWQIVKIGVFSFLFIYSNDQERRKRAIFLAFEDKHKWFLQFIEKILWRIERVKSDLQSFAVEISLWTILQGGVNDLRMIVIIKSRHYLRIISVILWRR